MLEYKAPKREIQFLLKDVFHFEEHYKGFPNGQDLDGELLSDLIDGISEFAEKVIAPLNQTGDDESCHLVDGKVITPSGFKEAYQEYVEGGWPSLSHEEKYGGQGLPHSLDIILQEMLSTANWSWNMYPGLSHGAMNTLTEHGTEQQKQIFLTKLVEGQWTGTMCLTEPQCGTDLGLVSSKAEPMEDGSYKITGSKIFISAGDHDFTENIIHIVLARTPGAPAGTKGISLFIVPKYKVNDQGESGEFNEVHCTALEKKMGIKGSATAVLSFEGSQGYLIGRENKGLTCMFTFMNAARIGTASQGVCAAELSFQGSIKYARERLSMRSLSGTKYPDQVADPLIVHPDVRRMLLTQKAFAEGGRAALYYMGQVLDIKESGATEDARQTADRRLGLLTPILKGFLTEVGLEAANLGIQVYGGHGYIKEWGMEQIVRDTRIATLYEGTTGIQALDLIGRKVMMDRATELKLFISEIKEFCGKYGPFATSEEAKRMRMFTKPLGILMRQWNFTTMKLMLRASKDRDTAGAASSDYLMYSGYILLAYMWALMAEAALKKLAEPDCKDERFYKAKVKTARFYFDRILPRTKTLVKTMTASNKSLMALPEDDFIF
ncbi:MAG: acyl-CoA dehydrogenase [SAR324 cluster bacterium]|uniref:3-methylmercaptopropionyl-CoA dehydrogenase n=1 Tax=SAR324 cluster bacterium TaxID=2024889 RepID=A0A2A4T243_9DELT|nr:MAG: acyl-CoA dehydrogenase [SAR324 cluster bacterium]